MKQGHYSELELRFIKAVAPYASARQIAAPLGRKPSVLANAVCRRGIHLPKRKTRRLSDRAVHVAWDVLKAGGKPDVSLFHIPEQDGAKHAHKVWSEAEDEELRSHAGFHSLGRIASYMGRTECAIKQRLRDIGALELHFKCGSAVLHRELAARGIRCCADSVRKMVRKHCRCWREGDVLLINRDDYGWMLENYRPWGTNWAALAAARGEE